MDWYTVGTLFYDMLTGCPPFYHDDAKIHQELTLKSKFERPDGISDDGFDVLQKLLEKDPKLWLGARNDEEVKSHDYFSTISWSKVLNKEL